MPMAARSPAASSSASSATARRGLPDVAGVVLDPARPREVLLELAIRAARELRVVVEDEAGRAGRALVDREDHGRDGIAGHHRGTGRDREDVGPGLYPSESRSVMSTRGQCANELHRAPPATGMTAGGAGIQGTPDPGPVPPTLVQSASARRSTRGRVSPRRPARGDDRRYGEPQRLEAAGSAGLRVGPPAPLAHQHERRAGHQRRVMDDRHREHERPARGDAAPAGEQPGAPLVRRRAQAAHRGRALDATAPQQPAARGRALPAGRRRQRDRDGRDLAAHRLEQRDRGGARGDPDRDERAREQPDRLLAAGAQRPKRQPARLPARERQHHREDHERPRADERGVGHVAEAGAGGRRACMVTGVHRAARHREKHPRQRHPAGDGQSSQPPVGRAPLKRPPVLQGGPRGRRLRRHGQPA